MNGNETLIISREGATAILTLNRPDQRNAFNRELLHALADAARALREDTSVRAVVVTGAGGKAFCAGADIREMDGMNVVGGREWALLGQSVFSALEALPQPVIAAVEGTAVGGGCELALACDVRIASETARFGQPEVKLGLIPGWGGTQRLTRLVGGGVAKDLVMTGRLIDAAEAQRIGLATEVTPSGGALVRALEYAAQFAALPPLAVAYAKSAIDSGAQLPIAEAMLVEVEQFGRAFETDDRREGLEAFIHKRAARFTGK